MTAFSAVRPSNQLSSKVVRKEGRRTAVRDVQPENTHSPMVTTESGINMLEILLPSKASSPMTVNFEGMVTGGARKEGRRV